MPGITESGKTQTDRRKRINRLKKMIIGSILFAIVVPVLLCILLGIRVGQLERQNASLRRELQLQAGSNSSEVETQEMLDKPGEVEAHQGELVQSKTDESQQPEILPQEIESAEDTQEWDGVRRVYLTFDDGPSSQTDDILRILDEYDIKATFFVVGKTDQNSIEMYQEIAEQGHTLGMHSYSHKYQELYASIESFTRDLEELQTYLYDLTGQELVFYRFPGGSSNTVSRVDMQAFIQVLEDRDITYFDWNVSSGDGGSALLSVRQLENNIMKDVESYQNVVVLMHDAADKSTTVEALPIIIEDLLALENVEILPITEDTLPVQHVKPVNADLTD